MRKLKYREIISRSAEAAKPEFKQQALWSRAHTDHCTARLPQGSLLEGKTWTLIQFTSYLITGNLHYKVLLILFYHSNRFKEIQGNDQKDFQQERSKDTFSLLPGLHVWSTCSRVQSPRTCLQLRTQQLPNGHSWATLYSSDPSDILRQHSTGYPNNL